MFEFLKGFFGEKELYTLGAMKDDIDIRDIKYSDIVPMVSLESLPEKASAISNPENYVSDQKNHGACVAHSEGGVVDLFLEREKIENKVSKKWLYAKCKSIDLYPDQGTYPRVASDILVKFGVPTQDIVDDNHGVDYINFIKLKENEVILANASNQKVKGFVTIEKGNFDAIRQAIVDGNIVTVTLPVDWNTGWRSGSLVRKPKNISGYHRVRIFKYDGDTFYFINSWGLGWGNRGIGYFNQDDFEEYTLDARVYTDIPNETLKKARDDKFFFTQTLRLGSRGYEVKRLQQALGIPDDGFFGPQTKLALIKLQEDNGYIPDGIFGRSMRALLNGTDQPKKKDAPGATLSAFADAIQDMEGYFPGSRSYRNNNPFNLRFVGQKTAIRSDDKGFCVFPSYAVGRMAGIDQIRRVMANKSSSYKKDCTILEFFHTYAPMEDNNDSNKYASYVAQKLKVDVSFRVKDLVDNC